MTMRPMMPARQRLVFHVAVLLLLLGGFCVSRVFAQGAAPLPEASAASLLDRWLSPDAVIGGALVLLYVGELRGDVKRLKVENAAMNKRLHDDYITKELAEAKFMRRRDWEHE